MTNQQIQETCAVSGMMHFVPPYTVAERPEPWNSKIETPDDVPPGCEIRQLKNGRWQWSYSFKGRNQWRHSATREEAAEKLHDTLREIKAGHYKAPRSERGITRLPNGQWQYSWTYQGRERRRRAPTRAIAEANLSKIRTMIAEGKYLEKAKEHHMPFADAVAQFLDWSRKNLRPGTHLRDTQFAKRWLVFPRFKGRNLDEIQVLDVEAYRNERARNVGQRTCDYDLGRLQRLFKLSETWGLCTKNPALGVKLYRPESRRDRYLSEAEEAVLLEQAPEHIRPAMIFSLSTGIRQGELISPTWGQVNLVARTLTITAAKAKGKRARMVPLNDTALGVLQTLPKGESPDQPVFPELANRNPGYLVLAFTRIVKRAGLGDQKITWHTLRHTFCTRLVQSGVDLVTAMILMGHSSLVMVQRYSHANEAHLQEAVGKLVRKAMTPEP